MNEPIERERTSKAADAAREYERALRLASASQEAFESILHSGDRPAVYAAVQRHSRFVEELKASKDKLIACLTHTGKRVQVDGIRYESVPSRREIRRVVQKRALKKARKD